MSVARPWIDTVPNSNIQNSFQALLTNIRNFHAQFCKTKNANHFGNIADTLDMLQEKLEGSTPPSVEEIANLFTVIEAQLGEIRRKKEGQHNQTQFTDLCAQIAKAGTKLRDEISAGIRVLADAKQQSASSASASSNEQKLHIVVQPSSAPSSTPVALRQALTHRMTSDDITALIEGLRAVPEDLTSTVNRMAKKHSYLTFGGLASLAMASGSAAQTGVKCLFNMLSHAYEQIPENLGDYALPVTLTLAAAAMIGAAYYKSRPAPAPVKSDEKTAVSDAQREQSVDTGPRAPLLTPRGNSSDAV